MTFIGKQEMSEMGNIGLMRWEEGSCRGVRRLERNGGSGFIFVCLGPGQYRSSAVIADGGSKDCASRR